MSSRRKSKSKSKSPSRLGSSSSKRSSRRSSNSNATGSIRTVNSNTKKNNGSTSNIGNDSSVVVMDRKGRTSVVSNNTSAKKGKGKVVNGKGKGKSNGNGNGARTRLRKRLFARKQARQKRLETESKAKVKSSTTNKNKKSTRPGSTTSIGSNANKSKSKVGLSAYVSRLKSSVVNRLSTKGKKPAANGTTSNGSRRSSSRSNRRSSRSSAGGSSSSRLSTGSGSRMSTRSSSSNASLSTIDTDGSYQYTPGARDLAASNGFYQRPPSISSESTYQGTFGIDNYTREYEPSDIIDSWWNDESDGNDDYWSGGNYSSDSDSSSDSDPNISGFSFADDGLDDDEVDDVWSNVGESANNSNPMGTYTEPPDISTVEADIVFDYYKQQRASIKAAPPSYKAVIRASTQVPTPEDMISAASNATAASSATSASKVSKTSEGSATNDGAARRAKGAGRIARRGSLTSTGTSGSGGPAQDLPAYEALFPKAFSPENEDSDNEHLDEMLFVVASAFVNRGSPLDILSDIVPVNPEFLAGIDPFLWKAVMSATHIPTGRKVLVKVSTPLPPLDEKRKRRRAIRRLQQAIISHKIASKDDNVVDLVAAIWALDDTELWVCSEYMNMGPLTLYSSFIPKHSAFKEEFISYVLGQVLLGIEAAHSRAILLREIRSDSIQLNSHGEVKIASFDTSITMDSPQDKRGSLQGVSYWMAPNQIPGPSGNVPAYGQDVDIWALGILGLELLHGAPPFIDLDPITALARIKTAPTSPPIDADCSQPLADFIGRCLELDPKKRPTAHSLLSHKFLKKGTKEGEKNAVAMYKSFLVLAQEFQLNQGTE